MQTIPVQAEDLYPMKPTEQNHLEKAEMIFWGHQNWDRPTIWLWLEILSIETKDTKFNEAIKYISLGFKLL